MGQKYSWLLFIFMAEILGGYWQLLDRSGKKIILLSPLLLCYIVALLHTTSSILVSQSAIIGHEILSTALFSASQTSKMHCRRSTEISGMYIWFSSIANVKCTPLNRRMYPWGYMYPRLRTPNISSGVSMKSGARGKFKCAPFLII